MSNDFKHFGAHLKVLHSKIVKEVLKTCLFQRVIIFFAPGSMYNLGIHAREEEKIWEAYDGTFHQYHDD